MDRKVIVFGVDGLIPELIYKFSQEGYLPNISQMMRKGSCAELLPFISTWGDVNWVSFLTGQSPGTSWKGQRIPPDNINNLLGSMDQHDKRCALVHYPESLSTKGTRHIQFAPFWSGEGSPPFELVRPVIYSTVVKQCVGGIKGEYLGWPPVGTLAYHEKGSYLPIEVDGPEYHFTIRFINGSEQQVNVKSLSSDQIELTFNSGDRIRLCVGQWSEWRLVSFGDESGYVQFKLLVFNERSNQLELMQSQINRMSGYCDDQELEASILERSGPFISKWTVSASPDERLIATSFEEGEYQAMWLAKTALMLVNEQNFDLFATVFRLVDETHHTCLGEYDPMSPFYSPGRALICEETMRKSYEILDRAIGYILQEKSEDTFLIVASDHGGVPNSYLCDIYQRMATFGLSELNDQGLLVIEKSKVYLKNERGGMEIFVNLRGRDPQGIVDAKDYGQVQTEIFHALSTWYHVLPKGKRNVIGVVLKKQDAAMIGYWGTEMGDIIFAYNQGFVWGFNDNRDEVAPVNSPGANHGPQIPSANTQHSSNYGMAIFCELSGRGGAHRSRLAPYRMNDAGVTIARLLGITESEGLDGRVMQDMIRS